MNGWTTRRRNKSQQEEFIIAKAYNHGAADAGRELTKVIEELRARVKELEGMVPKWKEAEERRELKRANWMECSSYPGKHGWIWLMVPPIPFPEELL